MKQLFGLFSFRPVCPAAIVAAGLFLCALCAGSCSNNDEYGELPGKIAEFVSTYFPGQAVESYTHSGANYHVRIKNGPGLTFGDNYSWTAVDGYGLPLPQVMLFDQLPPKLYGYLQDSRQLDSVFGMERDTRRYVLTLLDSSLTYDIATGELSGTVPTPARAAAPPA